MSARDNKEKWVFVGRRAGMSPEKRAEVAEKTKEAIWHGFCRVCKAKVSGTLDECRAHKCEVQDGTPSSQDPGTSERSPSA